MSNDQNVRAPNAGYNKSSFFHAGREEPVKGGRDEEEEGGGRNAGWDVFADFNNAGPRYSGAVTQNSQGYTQLPATSNKLMEEAPTNVEMVTVPALGPEWGKVELHDMTKAGKSEKKSESRQDAWKAWNRGERGICGDYCGRKTFVFSLFGLCALVGIALAFTIPRVPAFTFSSSSALANATGSWAKAVPIIFSRAPTNFSFPAYAALQLDTTANYIPITFTSLQADVFDLQTSRQVATGNMGRKTFQAKTFTNILLPLNFTYVATNASDQTWANWYNACRNAAFSSNGTRPPAEFRLLLTMNILGLPTSSQTSAEVADAPCPVELSQSAP